MNSLRLIIVGACVAPLACDPGSKSVTATAAAVDEGEGSASGSGSDTGSDSGDDSGSSGDYGGNCVETVTVLSDVNAVGVTSILPTDVLLEAEGIYEGSLRWLDPEGPVLYQGALGPTPVMIQVAYAGGEIRDVDAELVTPCQHDGPCPCPDRLEIDVRFGLSSEDGVLAEVWDVTLNHELPDLDGLGSSQASTGMYHRFEPDDAEGTLSRSSFDIDIDTALNEMVMTGSFNDGALAGALNADISIVSGPAAGSIGFGTLSNFAAVRSLDACPGLSGESCEAAGCTAIAGIPVWGDGTTCNCGDAEDLCFPAPLQGESTPTLYTRPDRSEEGLDLVYLLDTLVAEPPAPWRLCADAPEVPQCGCFGGMGMCP